MRKWLTIILLLVCGSPLVAELPYEETAAELFESQKLYFRSPLAEYSVTSGFGERLDPFGSGFYEFHRGIDLFMRGKSCVVRAMSDGVISDHWPPPGVYGGKTFKGHPIYGGCIVIEHKGGIHTLYGHLSKTYVKEGQRVNKGDIIGIMGSTGRATGPHLHLGVFLRMWTDTGITDIYYDPKKTLL